jgi:hypothetical protein
MSNNFNTHIYKIFCLDKNINDFYIGSTSNINRRKREHKCRSFYKNSRLYRTIRNNGGWENWNVEILESLICNNKIEKLRKEKEYIKNLKPSLNIVIPLRTKQEYYNDNRTNIIDTQKNYYNNNRNNILKKQKKKFFCECGCITDKAHIATHRNTHKHTFNLFILNNLLDINNL